MKDYFEKLEWKSYKNLISDSENPFTELDNYADKTFDNGIKVRISTGEMVRGSALFPYEIYINHPVNGLMNIPKLNKKKLNEVLNSLSLEVINNI